MKQGGLNDYVHQVGELRYLEIVPVLVMAQGDSKSRDTLVSQSGGKNCKGRVSRLCMTPFKHLSNPMHCCQLVLSSHLHRLQCQSINEDLSKDEQDEYRGALAKMSMHLGDNILLKMTYGANEFGITLAMPTDMMHASESGVIKYINKVFVASMPLSMQVKVDLLIENLFVSNCQFAKTLLSSRTNFDGGGCLQPHYAIVTSLARSK
jgi:hypothetical protein